jgi:hypothetical protein
MQPVIVRSGVFDLPLLVVSWATEMLVAAVRKSPNNIAMPVLFICLLSSPNVEDAMDRNWQGM